MAVDQMYADTLKELDELRQAVINMREALHDHLVDEHPPCLVCGTFYRELEKLVSADAKGTASGD